MQKQYNSNFDHGFSNALSLRGIVSKMSVSIPSEDCGLFQYTSVITINNLKYNIEVTLGPYHVQEII